MGKLAAIAPRQEELEPIETASPDELAVLQLQRLAWSLRHAYENVPHHRRSFDAAGAHPDDLKRLADLCRFPFTTKEHLGCTVSPTRDQSGRDLALRIKSLIGVAVAVETVAPGTIERSAGKARRIVDLRGT